MPKFWADLSPDERSILSRCGLNQEQYDRSVISENRLEPDDEPDDEPDGFACPDDDDLNPFAQALQPC